MCHSQLTLFVPEQATLLSFRLMPLDSYFFFFFFSYTFINLNIVLANYVVHIIHCILSLIKCKMSLQQISLLRNDILFLISLAHAKTKDGKTEREKNKDGTSDIRYSAYCTPARKVIQVDIFRISYYARIAFCIQRLSQSRKVMQVEFKLFSKKLRKGKMT